MIDGTTATFAQVMGNAAQASGGDNVTVTAAATVIDQFLNTHAPNANDGDNGDLTDDQLAQLADARLKLMQGQHIVFASTFISATEEAVDAAGSQAALLATGNVGAAAKNLFTSGKELAKDIGGNDTNTTGPDLDPLAAWFKKYKPWIAAGGVVLTVLALASIFKSIRDIDPAA